MKKIFCLLLFFVICIVATLFNGCFDSSLPNQRIWFDLHQQPLHSIVEYHAIAVGKDGLIGTSDGRPPSNWIERTSGTNQSLNSVTGPVNNDSSFAYAVGNQGVILRTTDNGLNWNIIRAVNPNYPNLNGLEIITQFAPLNSVGYTNIVAVGDQGTVIKSSNTGGVWTWQSYNLGINTKLKSVAANSGIFVVVGERGTIFRSLNSGQTWENRSLTDTNSLNKVVSLNYDRFCAVGNNGRIYVSTDYGYNWGFRSSGTAHHLRDVMFSGLDSGIAVGDAGTVRHTTNGGITWLTDSYFNSLTTRNIICVSKVDQNTVSSITYDGLPGDAVVDTTFFLAVSSVPFLGIKAISNFIAEVFGLKQNYPNPFNPVTNIEISIPKTSFVRLLIYDIQGREIETLVNSELTAGGYKIDWDASNYPSGVYFYKLVTNEFTSTRKMILVK